MPITINSLSHIYMPKSPFSHLALDNINLTINEGEMIAIAGHTGSGKSTLVQHFNGLLKPSMGEVLVDGIDINKNTREAKKGRNTVGMVFQYPEHQLFEETIAKDIAFGPRNYGLPEEEIDKRVRYAMDFVELDYEEFSQRSPFQLSGGQMRRVAIAGIIALKPRYLVLDEPTAGLDPIAKERLLGKIKKLHDEEGTTIIFVTHNMEDIVAFAKRAIIMKKGKIIADDIPGNIFSKKEIILEAGLELPQAAQIAEALREKGISLSQGIYEVEKISKELVRQLRRNKNA